MLTLAEMAAKGKTKLTVKAASMKSSYDGAKSRMKTAFAALPFGPVRTANYNAGVDAATYRAPDPEKWATNWAAKMAE